MDQNSWSETVTTNGNEFFNYMQDYGNSQDIPPTEADTMTGYASNTGKTILDDDEHTQVDEKFNYITGWLVCIQGPQKGRDFRLHSGGYNRIGRNTSYDVPLTDTSISREFSMWACYDPLTRQYLAGVKAGGNLVHLNDALFPPETPRPLKRNDKIQIGTTVLMFIPLCDDQFTWDEKEA